MSSELCSAPSFGLVYRSKAWRSRNRYKLRCFWKGFQCASGPPGLALAVEDPVGALTSTPPTEATICTSKGEPPPLPPCSLEVLPWEDMLLQRPGIWVDSRLCSMNEFVTMSQATRDKLVHQGDVYHVFVQDRFYIPYLHRFEHTGPLLAICDWSEPSLPSREVVEDAVELESPSDFDEYPMEYGSDDEDGLDNPVDTLVRILEHLGADHCFVSRELVIDAYPWYSIGGMLDYAIVKELLEGLIQVGIVTENEEGMVMLSIAPQS